MTERRPVGDARGSVLERPQRAVCVLCERMTRLRRHDTAPDAGEQIDAEGPLELAHLLGDRRLRDAQRLGRGGERPVLRCRREAADLLQRQKLCFWFAQSSKTTLRRRLRA